MGKLWKKYEKNSVEKYMENNSVGKVWKRCEKNSVKKQHGKSVENIWKKYEKKIRRKNGEKMKKQSVGKM